MTGWMIPDSLAGPILDNIGIGSTGKYAAAGLISQTEDICCELYKEFADLDDDRGITVEWRLIRPVMNGDGGYVRVHAATVLQLRATHLTVCVKTILSVMHHYLEDTALTLTVEGARDETGKLLNFKDEIPPALFENVYATFFGKLSEEQQAKIVWGTFQDYTQMREWNRCYNSFGKC